MSAYGERLSVRTRGREQAVDVTDRVRSVVSRAGVRTGICTVTSEHTTAGIFVNENADPDVLADVIASLRRAVPDEAEYRHAEGNGPAHVRTVLTGIATTLAVRDGELALGTWQGIFLVDFDGPRERHIVVTVLGE